MHLRLALVSLTILAAAACAPQAKVVREVPADSGNATELAAEPAPPVESGPLLLEPPSLLGMPSDRDMRATADPDPSSPPVIANPSRETPSSGE